MKEKRNKIILLAAGIILYFVFGMLDSMRAFSAPIQTLFSILHYAGMICMIFGINYFGTTYIYKKQAQLGQPVRELIEKNDERNIAIISQAKARAFDVMLYVMLGIIFILIEQRTPLIPILLSAAALIAMLLPYAYYKPKFSKEM